MQSEFLKQVAEERAKYEAETAELRSRIEKLERYFDELKKKNQKLRKITNFRCIQIAKEILNEEPIIKYHPPFLNGLELDAFFQKCIGGARGSASVS